MKKFKIFHSTVNDGADVAANEWLEQNPDVKVIDFQYTRRNLSGDYNHLCILYEELGEIVEMQRIHDPFAVVTEYRCPKCGYKKLYDGNITLHDPSCLSCRKGGSS